MNTTPVGWGAGEKTTAALLQSSNGTADHWSFAFQSSIFHSKQTKIFLELKKEATVLS